MLKVIALCRPEVPTLADVRAADSRACADRLPRLGAPSTDREWTALVKIASGEMDIAPDQHERLVKLGLIARKPGTPQLTLHGRLTLGFPE
jgi:hypothetical protein